MSKMFKLSKDYRRLWELLAVLRQIAIMPAAMHNIQAADKMSRMAWDAIAKAEGRSHE